MNREILFKAKRIDNGEWVEGYIFKLKGKERYFIFTGEFDITGLFPNFIRHEIIPETICQYTKLTDRNGKKIFEHDIIKFDVYDYEKLNSSIVSDIKWCEDLCSLSVVVNKQGVRGTLGHFIDDNKEVEVIGNIFDNPELLH